MGMYDHLRCSAPLPTTPPRPGELFQTKALECELATYEITVDGRLVLADAGLDEVVPGTEVPYHGDILFCDCAGSRDKADWVWVTYRARFTSGRLVSITEVCREEGPQPCWEGRP